MSWYFIKLGDFARRQLLGTGSNLQFEGIRGDLGAGFPSPNVEGVLRPAYDLFAGDNITARIGAGSLCNPDLPIDLLCTKGEMVTFHAVDHPASQILRVSYMRHQLLVAIGHQQIGCRDGRWYLFRKTFD